MARTLGLDLGPNSIGWALIDDKTNTIIATGVRIFQEGVAHLNEGDREEPWNQQRRDARGARVNNARYRHRRNQLKEILIRAGLMPDSRNGQDSFFMLDPYEMRRKGLDEKLPPHEFGRALFHINQHRGFKSNRKTDTSEDSKIFKGTGGKTGITATAEAIEASAGVQVHQMLSDARDRVEGEVREDARSAYQWLLAILENFREQAQRVEDDWRGRSTEVREGVVRSRVEPENPNLLSPELVGAVAQEPVVEEPVAEPVEEPADVPSVEVNEPATVEPKAVDPLFSEPPSAEPEPESAPVDDGEPVAVLPDEDPAIPENLLLPVVRESEQKEQEPEAGGKSRAQRPRRGGDKKSNASAQPSVGLSPEALDAAKRTPYTGEVELVLAPPVSAATVARLYSDLTANPEIRILRTMGDWERGTTITLFLERPMPLVGMLSEIPEVTINAGDAEHLGLPTPGSQSTPGILISLSDPSVTAKE